QGSRDRTDRWRSCCTVLRPRGSSHRIAGQSAMSRLWALDSMSGAMRAQGAGALPTGVNGISIDSRTLVKGDAFFAIQGQTRDGHDFVEAALKAGAGLAGVGRGHGRRLAH